jgi:hypothetical protein
LRVLKVPGDERRIGTGARFWVWKLSARIECTQIKIQEREPMPGKQVVSDEGLSRALGIYVGMVSQVLNNPRRWLGSMRSRPSTPDYPPGFSMLSETVLLAM